MIWLDIFGVSEAGLNSLSADQITRLTSARHIIAPDRHITAVKQLRQDQPQAGDATVEIITWPSPFSRIYDMLARWRGEPTVILATGDPL